MIREHALLPVIPGREKDFEHAFTRAESLIRSRSGFRNLSLSRSIESPSIYLLLVEWDNLEDHTLGFRESAEYREWKARLHHFYEPFPRVEHFTPVV